MTNRTDTNETAIAIADDDAKTVRQVLDRITEYAGNRNGAMRKGGSKTPLSAKWAALQIANIAEAIAEESQ